MESRTELDRGNVEDGYLTKECESCGKMFAFPEREAHIRRFCSRLCSQRSRSVKGTLVLLDPDEFMGLLNWTVRRYTAERPIRGSEEFQSAYVALLIACKAFRGPGTPEEFVYRRMRERILRDKYGRIAVRRATKSVQIYSIDSSFGDDTRDTAHPKTKELDPADAAVGRELQERVDLEISKLPRRARQVARMRLYDGLGRQEMSKALGVAVGAITKYQHAAKCELLASLRWSWSGVEAFIDDRKSA